MNVLEMAEREEIKHLSMINPFFRGIKFRNNGSPLALICFERKPGGQFTDIEMWQQTIDVSLQLLKRILIRMGFIQYDKVREFDTLSYLQVFTSSEPFINWISSFFSRILSIGESDTAAKLLQMLENPSEWDSKANEDIIQGSDEGQIDTDFETNRIVDNNKYTILVLQVYIAPILQMQLNECSFYLYRNQFLISSEERRLLFNYYKNHAAQSEIFEFPEMAQVNRGAGFENAFNLGTRQPDDENDNESFVNISDEDSTIAIDDIEPETLFSSRVMNLYHNENTLDNGLNVWNAIITEWPCMKSVMEARFQNITKFIEMEQSLDYNKFYLNFRENVLRSPEARAEISRTFPFAGTYPRLSLLLFEAQSAATAQEYSNQASGSSIAAAGNLFPESS